MTFLFGETLIDGRFSLQSPVINLSIEMLTKETQVKKPISVYHLIVTLADEYLGEYLKSI